jgi:transposase-like protein
MDCVGCGSAAVSERSDRTAQGYRRSGAGTAANSSTSTATVSSIEHRCRATSTRSWCSVGQSSYADDTYLKVEGRWRYLYRAIDRDGNLIDTMLSVTRDMRAAQRFFCSARSVVGIVPDRVTTDGHNSYPRAIRSTLGPQRPPQET